MRIAAAAFRSKSRIARAGLPRARLLQPRCGALGWLPQTTIRSCSTNLAEPQFALAELSALFDENRDAIAFLWRLLEGAANAPAAPSRLDPPA
jgi:hypothetical protein